MNFNEYKFDLCRDENDKTKDCPNRKIGCHSRCEKYQRFTKKRQEANKKRYKENELNYYSISTAIKLKERKRRNEGRLKY